MRKLFSFLGMLMLCATLMAQTPSAFKYQAVARNQSGEVMADQSMNVRISILKGAQVEYSEVHSVTTNDLGLFSIEVGRGSPVAGTFFDIVWTTDPHFIRVEMDPSGGNNYMFIGISELLSVPYAQHAETVTNNDDADADPDNEIQDLKVVGNFLRITNNPSPTQIDLSQFDTDDQQISYDADQQLLILENGGTVNLASLENDADADPDNELQTVTQVGNVVSLSQGGGTFSVDDADANPINELQMISQNGNTISLSQGGGSVTITEVDGSTTNEIQDLTFNNNYLYITGKPHPTIVNLNPLMDNTDAQELSYDPQTGNLALDNGGVVNLSSLEDDADANPANELQTISRVGDEIVLSQNGGTVNIEDNDSNPTNEIQTVSQNGLNVTLSNGGGTFSVADDDNSPVNEIQNLMVLGDSLYITNNPAATAINIGALDNQTLNFSNSTYELTIANGNTVDLSDLKEDDDSNPINEIQDLYLSNDSLVISNNPWATVIDMGPYMDNTDAQTLGLAANSLSISGGNSVNLTSYLDNTDAQQLSIVGMNLSISGGNTVAIPSSADNLGNHTATQNIKLGPLYMSNDGDSEGIRITTDGNVTVSGGLFVGENATTNSDLYISGRLYDWDNFSYYVDPTFQSHINDLRVDAGIIVNNGGMNVTGNAAFVNNATVGGTFGVTGATTLSSTLAVTGNATMAGKLDVTGATTADHFVSTVGIGTAPMTVTSTTKVSNLNADLLDGLSSADFMSSAVTAGGDLSGAIDNLQIEPGVVTSAELASGLTLGGATTMTGTLDVAGATSLANTLYVGGSSIFMNNVTMAGKLHTVDNANFDSVVNVGTDLWVLGTSNLGNALNVGGIASFADNVTMNGKLNVSGKAFFISNVSMNAMLEVAGTATADQFISTVSTGTAPITVASSTKVTDLNADLLDGLTSADFMSSAVTAGGDLSGAIGNLQLEPGVVTSTELASGLTLAGATSMTGTLGVTGATTLSSTLGVTGNTTMSNATMSGTLGVTGATTLSSTLAVTGTSSLTDDVTMGGQLNVAGKAGFSSNVNMDGMLEVSGATNLTSTLAVTGNTTVGGTLGVTGDLTASDDLTVTNGATIGGILNVTGISTLASDLTVTNGDIDINGSKAFYFGDKLTDGSWRIIRDGNDLSFERRESGSWVQKTALVP